MADDEINFMDLACLTKITSETTWENFAGTINSSVWDAQNMTGTMYRKKLIEFGTNYGGPNPITVTEIGKSLEAEAEAKSTTVLDPLDDAILSQLVGGKRAPVELQNTLNIRPKDLALHLYKLSRQNFVSYEFRNGGIDLMLTEQGFLRANNSQRQAAPSPSAQTAPQSMPSSDIRPQAQAAAASSGAQNATPPVGAERMTQGAAVPPLDPLTAIKVARMKRQRTNQVMMVVFVVVVLALVVAYHLGVLKI